MASPSEHTTKTGDVEATLKFRIPKNGERLPEWARCEEAKPNTNQHKTSDPDADFERTYTGLAGLLTFGLIRREIDAWCPDVHARHMQGNVRLDASPNTFDRPIQKSAQSKEDVASAGRRPTREWTQVQAKLV
ncbi:hypothetical protein HK102_007261 [Quaeritorhiza haematococci]|nr:hypothetical protein HK102_007261 [Quaeritorhiza haematococci]